MLVVRRRAGESLLIGENIEVEILELSAGQVKIGIRAPREILVLRKEIHLTGRQNRVASAGVSTQAIADVLGAIRKENRPSDFQEAANPTDKELERTPAAKPPGLGTDSQA
jgi:carbon storage regulator